MNTPPRRKTWVYALIGGVLGLFILGSSAYVILQAISEMGPGAEARLADLCVDRLGRAAKAQLLYAEDNEGLFPASEAWVDGTWVYGEKSGPRGEKVDPKDTNESVFRCPSISAMRAGGYGYAFDSRLSRKQATAVAEPAEQPLVFDSRVLSRNATGLPSDLLPLPLRHRRATTNNAAFADGSVRGVSESNLK